MSNLRVDFAEQPADAQVAGDFAERPADAQVAGDVAEQPARDGDTVMGSARRAGAASSRARDERALAGCRSSATLLVPLVRRDVREAEGARLEIALTVCDGVLQISITVADPES